MIKVIEFDITKLMTHQEREQYAKIEKVIDAGLDETGSFKLELEHDHFDNVIEAIKWRYREAGWKVKSGSLGGGSMGQPHSPYVRFTHPLLD